ncbi:MAG TPA: hypothetical protein VIK91_18285 [Nannocystis sp.]
MKRLALLFGALVALGGCSPRYEAVDFVLRSQPPVPVRVDRDQIEIPVGLAVAVHAELVSGSNIEYTEEDRLELRSKDTGVLLAEDTSGAHNFVLIGVSEGETCVAVIVQLEEEDCIPVRVTAPAE